MYFANKFYRVIAVALVMDLQMNGADELGYSRLRALRMPEFHKISK